MFATSRFAKLLRGYVDVALGLLGDDEAATLILETASTSLTVEASSVIGMPMQQSANPGSYTVMFAAG